MVNMLLLYLDDNVIPNTLVLYEETFPSLCNTHYPKILTKSLDQTLSAGVIIFRHSLYTRIIGNLIPTGDNFHIRIVC